MSSTSRTARSLMNAKVNLGFYLLVLVLTFFSRKIFLDCLGKDFLGLTGVLGNILGMLNLAELGIGTAVSFALYKPLYDGDKGRVIDVVGLFGYFYKWVGSFVAIAAVTVSFFLPSMLENEGVPLLVAYVAFYSFLISSLLSYFVNYKQIVFSADQRQYLISIYSQSANLAKLVIQMSVAYFYANYYAWILIELSFGILYCIVLQCKLKHHYPWLTNSSIPGKELVKENPDILKRTRQVFIHKLKDFLLTQCDQIFVFAYVSLGMVTLYGNYMLIISKFNMMLNMVMGAMEASVGNLVAENNKTKILTVFWELLYFRYYIGGIVAFGVFSFASDFIEVWLGSGYVISGLVVGLIAVEFYFSFIRDPLDMFCAAYGLYSDTWTAWGSCIVFISIVLIMAPDLGIAGILCAKILTLSLFVFIWKPFYLFNNGFKCNVLIYWLQIVKLLLASFVTSIVTYNVMIYLKNQWDISSFLSWCFLATISSLIQAVLLAILLLCISEHFRGVVIRCVFIMKNSLMKNRF